MAAGTASRTPPGTGGGGPKNGARWTICWRRSGVASSARSPARSRCCESGQGEPLDPRACSSGGPRDDDRAHRAARGRQVDAGRRAGRARAPAGQDGRRDLGRSELAVFARCVARRPHPARRALHRSRRVHPLDGEPRSPRRRRRRDRRRRDVDGCLRLRRGDRSRPSASVSRRSRSPRSPTRSVVALQPGSGRFGADAQGGDPRDRRRVRRQQARPPDGAAARARDPLDDGDGRLSAAGCRRSLRRRPSTAPGIDELWDAVVEHDAYLRATGDARDASAAAPSSIACARSRSARSSGASRRRRGPARRPRPVRRRARRPGASVRITAGDAPRAAPRYARPSRDSSRRDPRRRCSSARSSD